MENSLSALVYKGSIPEAILESKKQKKLFVVYISGSDEKSIELEKSTWTDPKVAESLSKYCIFLRIPESSTDAANFCAIYPQKSVPSIAAIGYNGVQLWQSEGIVSGEVLASSLEKAWLGLHIQETTATVLTATLASKKPELSTAESSDISSSQQGSSSGTVVPPPSVDKHVESSDVGPPGASNSVEESNIGEHMVEGNGTSFDDKAISKSSNADKSLSIEAEQAASHGDEAKELTSPPRLDPDSSVAGGMSSSTEDKHPAEEKIINQYLGIPGGDSHLVTSEKNEAEQNERDKCVDAVKADIVGNNKSVNAASEVHLNIRLPSGVSLQDKFSVTSTLGMIKDYVDSNQASGIGPYDLAIPYPRKVFSNQDLSKSLSELGLFNRQALIVVPHQRATNYHRGGSSSDQTSTITDSDSVARNGGYFAYVKTMLSYINPLSYLGGNTSSSSPGQAQSGMWEYSPNPALQSNNLARTDRPYSSNSPNQSTSATGRNDNRSRQPTTSRFGSNIHTLKHDEDDSQFGDRNPFWNGNSTQYGGNSDGK